MRGEVGGDYVRHIAPFPVLGADGEPYEFPFLGGFNVPRPQFVDIDSDDDLDLFVQERSDDVMFFENVGSATDPELVWRTDRFLDLDVGEWFRFVDMNLDGDPDLLTEQLFSLIRYYRNDSGSFELVADTLLDTDGEAIFSDRQNIPNVTDIDCDGLPDLFIGRLVGTVVRYEAIEPVQEGPPIFRHVTSRFEGIEIVNQMVGSLHGANSMVFADVDDDGDQDLFWGDFFEPGLLLIENTGSCESPGLRGEPVPFPRSDPVETSGFNVPAAADIDGDGDVDVLLGVLGGAYNPNRTSADNLYFLEAAEAGYQLRTRRFLGTIDLGSESVVAAGDLDGDEAPDLIVSAKLDPEDLSTAKLLHFRNTGTASSPSFRLADTLDVEGSFHFAPELADLDEDGDLDLLLGTWQDGVRVAWNEGDAAGARWVPADAPLAELSRGSHTAPAVFDIDGDGDLDLLVGEASGTLNFYRNIGTAADPEFELVSDEWGDIDVGRRSAPSFTDLDGDGLEDLVVGREEPAPVCFLNTGAGEGDDARFEPVECPLPDLHPTSAPRFIDLDGDADMDLLTGTLGGGVLYFEQAGD